MTDTAVKRFQERIVQMMDRGLTGWHFTTGPKWSTMTIEEKCAATMEMWDAPAKPLDFKDSYRKAVEDTNRMNDKGEIPVSRS